MKLSLTLLAHTSAVFLLIAFFSSPVYAQGGKTVYVSETGDASASGESLAAPTTLDSAYKSISEIGTIIATDSITYSEPPAHSGMLTLKGYGSGLTLTLDTPINLRGDLTLSGFNIVRNKDNYHIYANGHSLTITEDVTSSQRLIAFGGTNGKTYTGDTDIRLLGGTYDWVCGGSSNAPLIGNSNIVFGGNANKDDTIESGCRVYGGGNYAGVTGKTSVTLAGNAVCEYLFGGSRSSFPVDTPEEINVNITGGNAMNIYGGTENYSLDGCNINVAMKGGTVEAIFGGSIGAGLTGNVNIDLLGGRISRRVYTGCYNEASIFLNYSTSHHVTGTTTLRIAPTIASSNISYGSDVNRGLFAGSRHSSAFDDEINTIIFLNGCYSAYKSKIIHASFDSKEDYTVAATAGGEVFGTENGGIIYIAPQSGKYAALNGSGEYQNTTAALTNTGTTVNLVEFRDRAAADGSALNTIMYDLDAELSAVISADVFRKSIYAVKPTDISLAGNDIVSYTNANGDPVYKKGFLVTLSADALSELSTVKLMADSSRGIWSLNGVAPAHDNSSIVTSGSGDVMLGIQINNIPDLATAESLELYLSRDRVEEELQ